MKRVYWDERELNALRHGFEFHVGMPWSDAVNLATEAGTVRRMQITPEMWARVAAIVGTRTADQCAKRLQTERRMEQERRAAKSASAGPEPMPELSLPFQTPRPWHCPPSAGRLAGLDVSPYLGKSKGRIVLSFNGRGAA